MLREIQLYGTGACLLDQFGCYKECLPEVMRGKRRVVRREEDLVQVKVPLGMLFHPKGGFLDGWSVLMLVLFLYSFLVIPYQVAFVGAEEMWLNISLSVDICFLCDILFTLNTAILQSDGHWVTSHYSIFKHYLQGMFLLDLVASVPFYLQFTSDNSNNLLRYFRLLRLTRLIRRSKILKVIRWFFSLTRKCAEMMKVYSGLSRLITALCTALILVHFGACMWFYSARLDEFSPDTWVVRRGVVDDNRSYLYFTSFYWAITTLTTVGYGDITARTKLEMCIAMCWMMFGVGFYSFVVGSFTSAFTSLDAKAMLTKEKLQMVHLFAKDTGINGPLLSRLEATVTTTTQTLSMEHSQRKSLLAHLTKPLRLQLAKHMFDDAASKIVFFTEIDSACLSLVVPLLSLRVLPPSVLLYEKDDYADEIYFVLTGRLNCIYGSRKTAFKTIVQGAYCGEIEVIYDIPRKFSLITDQNCEILVMTKDVFAEMIKDFPEIAEKVRMTAEERNENNEMCLKEVLDVLEAVEIRHSTTFEDLAGQKRLELQENLTPVKGFFRSKTVEATNIQIEMNNLTAQLKEIEGFSQDLLSSLQK